jgi:hypothetical protein
VACRELASCWKAVVRSLSLMLAIEVELEAVPLSLLVVVL